MEVVYPDTPPVAIFRELQVRSFAYMLLMLGELGYQRSAAVVPT